MLLETNHGSHTDWAAEFPVVLLEEYTPGPVAFADTEIIDPKIIAAAANANTDITNTTGVYDYSDALTPIFTINSTQSNFEE